MIERMPSPVHVRRNRWRCMSESRIQMFNSEVGGTDAVFRCSESRFCSSNVPACAIHYATSLFSTYQAFVLQGWIVDSRVLLFGQCLYDQNEFFIHSEIAADFIKPFKRKKNRFCENGKLLEGLLMCAVNVKHNTNYDI